VVGRLRCGRPVRMPRDTETCPSRLLQAKKTSVTVFAELQVIPSQLQQPMVFSHELLKPPSWDSSETKWSKELLSFSVHEVARGTKGREESQGQCQVVACEIFWWNCCEKNGIWAMFGANTCPMYALRLSTLEV